MSIDRMRLPPELSAKCVSSIRTKGNYRKRAWSVWRMLHTKNKIAAHYA